MTKYVPYAALVVALLGGGASGAFINQYLQKEDYSISATSCSERGPEKAYIENIDTGYRVEVPMASIPVALERVAMITNTGKKPINDEDLHIAINNDVGAKILQTMIFYESPLSRHSLIADEEGMTFRVALKNFNPNDTMSVVVNSDRQIGLTVMSKGSGFTVLSSFKRGEKCGIFASRSYGGVVAYSKVAEGCTLTPTDLNLSCSLTESVKIPEDFPPGKARLIFR